MATSGAAPARRPGSATERLREKLAQAVRESSLIVAPGIGDPLSARVAVDAGFDVLFLSGFYASASVLGKPDTGMLGFADMVPLVAQIRDAVPHAILIVDGDTGYGGPVQVKRAVRAFARAGAAMVLIEDQQVPKQCGHTAGKSVVPRAEALARIQAATDAAREDPPILILARTDARIVSTEEAWARARLFRQIGADLIFIEAPCSEEEMVADGLAVAAPQLVNLVESSLTPILPRARLAEIGYRVAIHPVTALLAAVKAMKAAYAALAAEQSCSTQLLDFKELQAVVGFPEYFAEVETYREHHDRFATPLKVRIAFGAGGTVGVDDIAVVTAFSQGFWMRQGLEVEWIPAREGAEAVEAVLRGVADVAYGDFAPVLAARTRGEPTRILTSTARGLLQQLVVRKDRVKAITDLKGARWAVERIGALSDNLAILVIASMQIDVEWVVAGPPPERVAALLNGTADAALLGGEEAAVLARTHDAELVVLLGFSDLKRLAPNQPHGVLSTTEAFESGHPDVCAKLVRGLLLASRSLHDSQASFEQAVETHVRRISLTGEEVADIWRQEHDCKVFAVNGGMSAEHWEANQKVFELTNPGVVTLDMKDVLATRFIVDALEDIDTGEYGFDPCPARGGLQSGPPLR